MAIRRGTSAGSLGATPPAGAGTGADTQGAAPGQNTQAAGAGQVGQGTTTATGQFAASIGDWIEAKSEARRRLIVMAEAPEKSGKTHFSLTTPAMKVGKREGIGMFAYDVGGVEGVVQKFQKFKRIFLSECRVEIPKMPVGGAYASWSIQEAQQISTNAEKMWQVYWDKYRYAVEHFRTVVLDTSTDVYALLRLAKFGKLTEVKPQHYEPINRIMEEMINMAFSEGVNLVMIHKMKPEWQDNKPTGRIKAQGYGDAVFKSQVNVRLAHDYVEPPVLPDGSANPEAGKVKFTALIKPLGCRPNPDAENMLFVQPDCGFADVAMQVWPDSSPEDWL